MSKYYSIHEFSKIIGVSAQTLRNWDANGKLHPHHTTVSGYRYYSDEQLNQVINVKPKKRITIGYCFVILALIDFLSPTMLFASMMVHFSNIVYNGIELIFIYTTYLFCHFY